jgi:hypothetical protein
VAPPEVALEVSFGDTTTAVTETVLGDPTPMTSGGQRVAAAVSSNALTAPAAATSELYSRAIAGSLNPLDTEGIWSTFGGAAGRFGPWAALLGIAFVIETIAKSALKDRLRTRTVRTER